MELVKVGEKTFYIKNNTNIGVYKVDGENVYIIDSGKDKDAGKEILKIINNQGWNIKGIIVTHSNADQIGGNKVIQERTNCDIFSLNCCDLYGPFSFARIAIIFSRNSSSCHCAL